MKSQPPVSGLSGRLTRHGRLTRGGVWLLVAFGGLMVISAASQWRAISLVVFGQRASGSVVRIDDVIGDQRDYRAGVTFSADGTSVTIIRALGQPRGQGGASRLRVGDTVAVAYRAVAPAEGVLVHAHEPWAAAPWMFPVGCVLWAMAWWWRPRSPAHGAGVP